MAVSLRFFLNVLNDAGRVYEGRTRYMRLFKAVRKVEQLYRKSAVKIKSVEAAKAQEIESATHQEAAQLLATICSQNGAMWVKVAQYLSCRPDLLPEEYINTFSDLQTLSSNTHAQPFVQVQEVLTQAWGDGWDQYFSDFNMIPVAIGSIAQVYKARLKSSELLGDQACLGNEVAVKVRVPGVEELYNQDSIVLLALAKCIDPFFKEFHVVSIIEEIIAATTAELDFSLEKASIQAYSKLDKKTVINTPVVVDSLSQHSVLVTQWIDAQPLQMLLRNESQQQLCDDAIQTVTGAIIEDIFRHGLYHGDPHPGNILVGDKLYFIDFGLVGRLNAEQRGHYFFLMLGFMGLGSKPDFERLFTNAGFTAADPSLFTDIGNLVDDLQSDKMIDVRSRLQAIFNSLRQNKVVLPSGFVGIIRVVLLLSGLFQARSLDFSKVFSGMSL